MDISNDTRLIANFNKHVDASGHCHIWTGCIHRTGYGQFGVHRKIKSAHRVAYEIAYGPIRDGLQVDHMCHNRACVNPEHLRLVTNKQNQENRKGPNPGTSGALGVHSRPKTNQWVAAVRNHGVYHYGGIFNALEDAEAAARELRNSLYTHNTLDHRAP